MTLNKVLLLYIISFPNQSKEKHLKQNENGNNMDKKQENECNFIESQSILLRMTPVILIRISKFPAHVHLPNFRSSN